MKMLAIFDLDGTLLDTVADLGGAVNHTLAAHGLPQFELPEYKMKVGRGMRNLVKAALPGTHQEDAFVDSFLGEFLDHYLSHIDVRTRPYPGIPEMLGELDSMGVKIAVASNKIQKGTEHLVREFFPDIPFAAICGNSPGFPLKPDPALVQYIMDRAGASKEETFMVGDSGIDITTAHNAGIRVIAVTWGFRPREDLLEADFTTDVAAEITEIIKTGQPIG